MDVLDIRAPDDLEGTKSVIGRWLKAPGEAVALDEPIVELETDKVAMEVFAPASGILTEIRVEPGGEAAPGDVLARMQVGASTAPAPTAIAAPSSTSSSALNAGRSIAAFDPALRLSPSVRRLLMESGADPGAIAGTGRDGRLTLADVRDHLARPRPLDEAPPATTPLQVSAAPNVPSDFAVPPTARSMAQASSAPAGRLLPHNRMRLQIAEHMSRSLTVAPHVTALFEADFSRILAHRNRAKAEFAAQGVQLTLTAYFILACVQAMAAAPAVNSRWRDEGLEIFDDINIGVGAALGDKGLVVPVLHKAQSLSLFGVAERLQDLLDQARTGRLRPADVQGGTFSISNHGVSGSLSAAPIIINQPQSAILGVGKLQKRVVVREVEGRDAMVICPMAYVSLSIDHRVLDGFQTNAWLTRFVEVLETWPPP